MWEFGGIKSYPCRSLNRRQLFERMRFSKVVQLLFALTSHRDTISCEARYSKKLENFPDEIFKMEGKKWFATNI